MPRASTSQIQANALGRNQACHQCRKRKLKCDATLPCTPCTRSHAHTVKLYPNTAPAQPECIYDNPEEIAEGPKGKICRLEAQIAELEALIRNKDAIIRGKDTLLAGCICRVPGVESVQLTPLTTHTSMDSQATLSTGTSGSMSPSLADPVTQPQPQLPSILSPLAMLDLNQNSNASASFEQTPSASGWQQTPTHFSLVQEPEMVTPATLSASVDEPGAAKSSLSLEIWPLNIPPPELLHHLVETVFNSVPLASRAIHRPSFMTSLTKPPSSPEFPHVSLLHAFCALASIYTPVILDMNHVDFSKELDEGAAATLSGGVVNRGFHQLGKRYFPRRLEDITAEDEYDFASSHVRWCDLGFLAAMQRGDALIQQVQACMLCTWFFHSRGKFVSSFLWFSKASRIVPSLGLHQSPGFGPLSRIPAALHYTIPAAQTPVESETRRNLFWVVYTTVRILNVSNVWPMVLVDEDTSQMMPCRLKDFETGQYVPTQGRQRLFSHKMLVSHPRLTTDAFTLYTKACVLLGKVKTFNGRFRYRYTDGDGSGRPIVTPVSSPSSGSSPGTGSPNDYGRSVRDMTTIDPTGTDEFVALDELIDAFIVSIPREFRDPVGLETGMKLDPTLYMAHMLPHMAMIALHDPHANVFSARDASAEKLLKSARAILELIYKLCSTTFDLIYLDPASSTAWFVAGVTLIRFLNARTVQQDQEEIKKLTQELGVVRFMLGNLGDRTAVGFRQIKLLDMVYKMEMGSHTSDNQLGVLYPASVNEVSP